MKSLSSERVWQTIGFGLIAGMRSLSAPALISHYLSNKISYRLNRSPLRFIKKPLINKGLKVLAVSEMVGDKLPAMPDRISGGVLAGRAVSGAITGAVIYKSSGGKITNGALLGCATAIVATYATFYLRKKMKAGSGLPDSLLGLAEDVIAIGGGIGLLKSR
ncbi:DUF4126 family protein [Rubrolithibacter danxiaensis]|uniref:DUF4126 family protein n=1 Tax=Rubrolithibacter danxiaensis TaxID=3390805 RepID=UPI003BF88C89